MTAHPLRRALLGLAGFAAAAGPASAFDCAKARQPAEKAICADPAAKASDDAMDSAFAALRAGLDGEQRRNVLDDQRAWLTQRNDGCMAEEKPAACFAERNATRIGMLTARPESGPGPERPLHPVFVRQAGSRTKIAVGLQLFRFTDPQTPGERTLDAEADKAVSGTQRIKDEPDERDWSSDESWAIAYASPAFLSIVRTTYDYSGGAHGTGGTAGLNIDMASGRVLAFADLFDKAAARQLSKLCLDQVKAEKTRRGAGDDDVTDLPKAVGEVVGDLANWSFRERAATVYFDPYAVGAYAEGSYDCTLPIEAVNRLAKRPMPLR